MIVWYVAWHDFLLVINVKYILIFYIFKIMRIPRLCWPDYNELTQDIAFASWLMHNLVGPKVNARSLPQVPGLAKSTSYHQLVSEWITKQFIIQIHKWQHCTAISRHDKFNCYMTEISFQLGQSVLAVFHGPDPNLPAVINHDTNSWSCRGLMTSNGSWFTMSASTFHIPVWLKSFPNRLLNV